MGLSASSNYDRSRSTEQAAASTPIPVPNQDRMGNENKQVTQTRDTKENEMQSDAAVAGNQTSKADQTSGKDAATAELAAKEDISSEGKIFNKSDNSSENVASYNHQISAEQQKQAKEAQQTRQTSSIKSAEETGAGEIQELVTEVLNALDGKVKHKRNSNKPSLPQPKIAPRTDSLEISLALATSITALCDQTQQALSNFSEMDSLAGEMSKISLEKQGLKIDSERAEYKKMQDALAKLKDVEKLNILNTVMIVISVIVTVLSIAAAIFTCGASLAGLAGSAALATGAATGAAATAGATAAATAAATSAATSAVTQTVTQAVIQGIKQAIIQTIKQAIKEGIKTFIKQGLKAAVKQAVKTLSKNISKIMSNGKSVIAKNFPNLSKVINALGSKAMTATIGVLTVAPMIASGTMSIQASNLQKELAALQKETGKMKAQADTMGMFTMFWRNASKIASKQVSSGDEMKEQATKIASQLQKMFSGISAALASAAAA